MTSTQRIHRTLSRTDYRYHADPTFSRVTSSTSLSNRDGEKNKSDGKRPTAYSHRSARETILFDFGDTSYTTKGGTQDVYYRYMPSFPTAYGVSDTKALNALVDESFSVPVELAESLETANHLASRGRDLAALLKGVKTGRFNKRAKSILGSACDAVTGKTAADRWLEYKYGIMPTVSSMSDLLDIMDNGLSDNPLVFTVKGVSVNHGNFPDKQVANYHLHVEKKWSGRSISTTSLTVRQTDLEARAMRLLGISRGAMAEVVWEMVPYSFVVDWGIGVGEFLSALTASSGLTLVHGYRSVYHNYAYSDVEFSRRSSLKTDVYGYSAFGETRQYDRRPILSFPIPSIRVKNPFSTDHLITSAALLRQLKP